MVELSPFEKLPLELKHLIFQEYLNNTTLDYYDQMRHDEHQRLKPCTDDIRIVESLSSGFGSYDNEAAFYRQDPSEGSGFWSPFGATTKWGTRVNQPAYNHNLSHVYARRCAATALWHVGGVIGDAARDFHLNERTRLVFTNVRHLDKAIQAYHQWRDHVLAESGDGRDMRKIFMDVNFTARGLPHSVRGGDTHWCRPINLRNRRYPLFRVDIRGGGAVLRVASLFRLVPIQRDALVQALVSAVRRCQLLQRVQFGGDDIAFGALEIFSVVDAVLQTMQKEWTAGEYVDGKKMTFNQTSVAMEFPIVWQVDLDAERLKKVNGHVQVKHMTLCRGPCFNVWIEEKALQESMNMPLTYEHVVAELRLQVV